ncbi:efflux transporter outer membrane subunit [Chromobacterium vaccinii]|uniref:efflux transporter outer membrane subunit n=1 Tax=Chromobacterium vaccinii TaxID=1108595 RepID=UPI001E2E2AD4|nr:efflux transporter outer membrane subunit [Chromobacterium vaccinii]MCD4500787.1 efflux transporter outer membrane subunit [Chromobacterium vaccinii]
MKAALKLTALSLAGALAGCAAVGPDYHLPSQAALGKPAANAAFQSANNPAFAQQPVPAGWWRLYDDARLDGLVEEALAANADLRAAAANLRKAMAVEASVNAERDPHASVSATVQRSQDSGEAYLIEKKLPVANVGDGGLQIGYEIDLFGKLARAEEAARAGTQATEAAMDLARTTVAAETVRAYVQGCAAGHRLAVARHELDLQNRGVAVAKRMQSAGRGRATDVERAQAQADIQRAALPRLQAEQDAARFRLAALLGKAPAEPPAAACSALPRLKQPLPVGDGAALLKRRPDVREAERKLAAATARIGVATAQLYPSVSLGASAGVTGLLEHVGEDRTRRWSLGPLISWTIPDSGARARVKAAEADADAALAHFDSVVLNALRETETALTFYAKDLERNADLRSARDNARAAAQDNRRLYAAGRTPYLASLDADRALAGNESALAASDAQLALDQVSLFLALGGGWEQTPR